MQIVSPCASAPVRARSQLQIQCLSHHAWQLGPQLQSWLFHSNPNIRNFLLGLDSSCSSSPQPRGHCLLSQLYSSGAVPWDSRVPGKQNISALTEPVKTAEHSSTTNAGHPTGERTFLKIKYALISVQNLNSQQGFVPLALSLNVVFRCFQRFSLSCRARERIIYPLTAMSDHNFDSKEEG